MTTRDRLAADDLRRLVREGHFVPDIAQAILALLDDERDELQTNEAAERLRAALEEAYGPNDDAERALDAALAAERRATVERIRAALPLSVLDECVGIDRYQAVQAVKWSDAERVLDEIR